MAVKTIMLRKVMHYGAKKKSNAHRLQKTSATEMRWRKNTAQMKTRLKKDSMALVNQRSLACNKYTLPDNRPSIKRAAHLAVFLCKILAIQLHKWMQPGRRSTHYTHETCSVLVCERRAAQSSIFAQTDFRHLTPSDAPLAETQVHSRPVQRL